MLDRTFTRKRRFSLREYAERSFGVFQEKPVDVVWKFSPKAAPDAREFLFHPTQVMEAQADGSLIVRFRAGGLLEMAWHLFTWGNDVKVLKPSKLNAYLNNGTISRSVRRRDQNEIDRETTGELIVIFRRNSIGDRYAEQHTEEQSQKLHTETIKEQ